MSVSLITHNSIRIVFADYTKCENWEDIYKVLEESGKMLESCNEPMHVLVDFTGQSGSREYMRRVREFNDKYGHMVSKRAILGITGMKKVLLMGFQKLGNNANKTQPFDTKEEALRYLTQD